MKKIKFLAMMIAALTFCMGFTACGDDDDDEPANPLVGTWVGTFDHDGGYYGDGQDVITMTFTKDGEMFANNENASVPQYNWTFSGTYELTAHHEGVYLISIAGYHSDYPDEYYDDDIEPEPVYINGNELVISFDGSDYRLTRQ